MAWHSLLAAYSQPLECCINLGLFIIVSLDIEGNAEVGHRKKPEVNLTPENFHCTM